MPHLVHYNIVGCFSANSLQQEDVKCGWFNCDSVSI